MNNLQMIARILIVLFGFIVTPILFANERDEKNEDIFNMSLEELIEVKVATRTKLSIKDAPSIISVITGKEIENMGARNLEDIIKIIPGFDAVVDPKYATSQVAVRGIFGNEGANDLICVMLNGHILRTDHSGDAMFYFDKIPVDNISRIEIIRGPGSALYGTGAFLGVINIITKIGGETPSKISLRAGNYNTIKSYGELSFKKGGLAAYLYADSYKTDGYRGKVESDFATITWGESFSAAPGKTTYDSKQYNLQCNIKYKGAYFDSYFHQMRDTKAPIGLILSLTDESSMDNRTYFMEIGYTQTVFLDGNISVKAFHDYYNYGSIFEIFSEETAQFFSTIAYPTSPPYPDSSFGGPNMEYRISGGEITFDNVFFTHHHIVSGIKYEHSKIDSYASQMTNCNYWNRPVTIGGTTYLPFQYLDGWHDPNIVVGPPFDEKNDRDIWALYAQWEINLKNALSLVNIENLALTSGVRYDDYSDVGSTINPRVGIIFSPIEKLYFKLLYGRAFRAPTFQELYIKNNVAGLGKSDIDPIELTTVEGLIGYRFSQMLNCSFNFFRTEIKNIIRVDPATTLYKNLGKMVSQGVEFETKWAWEKYKYAYMNLTYQHVKDITNEPIMDTAGLRQSDVTPDKIPSIIGNTGVNYLLFRNIITNFSLTYIGERNRNEKKQLSNDSGNLVLIDQRDDMDSQILSNISLIVKDFMLQGLKCQFSCYNVFNEDYKDPESTGVVVNDIPRGGTSYIIEVAYSF